MSNPITDDCSSGLHNYCTPCQCDCHDYNHQYGITKDEARALLYLINLHNGLLRQSEEQYTQILRLINGLTIFLDNNN